MNYTRSYQHLFQLFYIFYFICVYLRFLFKIIYAEYNFDFKMQNDFR